MTFRHSYFFCGIGGSGMMPLALILKEQGHEVAGSDRAYDHGRDREKFQFLDRMGIKLFAQDGSGLTDPAQIYVDSGAVERDKIADGLAASHKCWRILRRPALLADLFNGAAKPIGVAGTSGKSTTTAMIAWILHDCGLSPTVINGAVMKNFVRPEARFASALIGKGDCFVSELDESDGSIDLYQPDIAVLNNIAPDHKSIEELRAHFNNFVDRARVSILNLDNDETMAIAKRLASKAVTWSLDKPHADFYADDIVTSAWSVDFKVHETASGESHAVNLVIPGRYNVANAMAAIAAANLAGVPVDRAAKSLGQFEGTKRRFEKVGEARGVTVIDDFAHNPDKIAAVLKSLQEFPGRLLVMFQPQGFGPIRNFKTEFTQSFATHLKPDDILVLAPPADFGGTADRSFTSADLAKLIKRENCEAVAPASRDACRDYLVANAKTGDRIIIMGARDDTLTVFAKGIVEGLGRR